VVEHPLEARAALRLVEAPKLAEVDLVEQQPLEPRTSSSSVVSPPARWGVGAATPANPR